MKLEKWRAFKGKYPDDTIHRIIIIYPGTQLSCFVVTSQISKCKNRNKYDLQSLVEVTPEEWNDLDRPSCIQCGKGYLHKIDRETLIRDYENENLQILGEIPDVVKDKICYAIENSKTYNANEKNILKR